MSCSSDSKNASALTSVQEEDFLDQDPPLRGQNYVCLSFLSPEDALARKDVYVFEKFLERHVSADLCDMFEKLTERYPDAAELIEAVKERHRYLFEPGRLQDEFSCFERLQSSTLEAEFFEKNAFRTSMRGIKIRGVFETQKEAEVRAQVLKRLDERFHVYVAQVGCWCPWSPNPDDIENQEYAETQLNTLMKNYRENQATKDAFYEQRKREVQVSRVATKLNDEDDPWLADKASSSLSIQDKQDSPVDPKPA